MEEFNKVKKELEEISVEYRKIARKRDSLLAKLEEIFPNYWLFNEDGTLRLESNYDPKKNYSRIDWVDEQD